MSAQLTLYRFILDTAGKYGPRMAFRVRSGQTWAGLTYDEWYKSIRELAMGLVDLGMKRQDKVALIADNRMDWMVCSMAITTIGGVDVPRGTDATLDDLKYIIGHTEAEFLIAENPKVVERLRKEIEAFPKLKHIILLEGEAPPVAGKSTLSVEAVRDKGRAVLSQKGDAAYHDLGTKVDPEDLATIIYTSGTTGAPKGVMLLHRNLVWMMETAQHVLKLSGDVVTMCFLPPWHIAERLLEMVVIQNGGTGNMTSIPTIAKDLAECKPTFIVLVPRVWEALYSRVQAGVAAASPVARTLFRFGENGAMTWIRAKHRVLGFEPLFAPPSFGWQLSRFALLPAMPFLFLWAAFGGLLLGRVKRIFGGRVKTAISGAGALPYKVDLFFRAAGIPILEAYGMTETTGVSIFRQRERNILKVLGPPAPGVEMQLRTEDGRLIEGSGQKGVAWHKGGHIMRGYYKEPEKTRAVLDKDGFLNSGDLLTRTINGEYAFAGRAKDTIVLLGGENLEPVPIEDKLKESAYINNVMIVGQDRKSLGAIITPNTDAVKEWAKKSSVVLGEQATWNANPALRDLYKGEIKRLVSDATGFKGFERVTGFHILRKDFDAGQEMTQTMKVRRNVVSDMYAKEIDDLYEK